VFSDEFVKIWRSLDNQVGGRWGQRINDWAYY